MTIAAVLLAVAAASCRTNHDIAIAPPGRPPPAEVVDSIPARLPNLEPGMPTEACMFVLGLDAYHDHIGWTAKPSFHSNRIDVTYSDGKTWSLVFSYFQMTDVVSRVEFISPKLKNGVSAVLQEPKDVRKEPTTASHGTGYARP